MINRPPKRRSESNESPEEREARRFAALRPDYDIPEVPERIVDFPDKELMTLFSQTVAWQNYCTMELARAEVAEDEAEALMKRTDNLFLLRRTGTITDARMEKELDPECQERRSAYEVAHAFRKMVQAQQQVLDRNAQFLSREISRRIGRDPVQQRQARYNP